MGQLSLDQMPSFVGQSNVEIEELVLGCFINFPDSYYLLSDQVSIKDFTKSETRYIYNSIKDISKESVIDIATVTDMIVKKKYNEFLYKEKQMNIISYLEEISDRVDTNAHIKEHIRILNEYNQRREFFILSRDINEACNESKSTGDIINIVNQKVLNIQQMGEVKDFDQKKSIDDVIEDIQAEESEGVKSGVPKLDEFIHQFDYNNFIVIAGAPSMGKTAFALEVFKNGFYKYDYKPLFFSLEMSVRELTKRLLASCSCIPLRKLRDKSMDAIDIQEMKNMGAKFKDKEYFIDDKSRSLGKIINQIRKHVIRHGTKVVIVDYLQLVTYKSKSGSREQEIATISRALKEVAAELGIVVIALSQLNRQVNSRNNKRPMLSDLRESGAIEQDADMVIFPYRPAYYMMAERPIPPLEDDVEIIIAKGRSTGVGTVHVSYISKYVKFVSDYKEHEKIQVLASQSVSVEKNKPSSGNSQDSDQGVLELGKKGFEI